jgi:translocation and assembly module TamB
VQSHVQYDAPALTLQNLSVADGGSTLTGRASYNLTTEAMSFAVRVSAVEMSRLRPLGIPETVEGRIQQADLTGSGTRTHPEVDGTIRLQNLAFQGESFPTARIDVNTSGSMVSLKVSETRNLELTADIDTAKNGYPFTAKTKFKQYSIEKLANFKTGTLTVSGDADLKGSLSDLAHISGDGHIDPMELGIQDQHLQSTRPFAFDFNSERLNLTDVSLVNDTGTQMNMSGTIGLTEGARLNLTVTGQVDAGLLASDKSWNIGGAVKVSGQIRGTVAKPDLQGQASFTDLAISKQGVTTSLTALKGTVFFDEHRMTFQNVEGRSGPGTIRVQGYGAIEGKTLGALNFRLNANSVRVRYPTGLRSVVDADIVVGGTLAKPTVSGDVEIQSLTFNSNFDEFLALFESGMGTESALPIGNLQLSLHVVGSRNISIKNELGSAEARVDLGVKGTLDNPALTGRVETNSGKLLFQGKTYEVTRGNVNFVDPVRIDPSIDIQAETSIRSYQVFLSISGKMDRLQLNLRSEPPLSQLEIVSLISGGKTTDEFRQSAKTKDDIKTGEQAFQGGAASILSDMLVSRVGSKFDLLGLERVVRVDPVLGAQFGDTTARITVPLQLTKDLSVTYSQILGPNKTQIIQVEYFVSKNLSILASKDENNVNALDLRIRKRF